MFKNICSFFASKSRASANHLQRSKNNRQRVIRATYRALDGLTDYEFSFEQQPDESWRIFLVSKPDYGNRDKCRHRTHTMLVNGREELDWHKPFRTLETAKQFSAHWAEATQEYIRTGEKF